MEAGPNSPGDAPGPQPSPSAPPAAAARLAPGLARRIAPIALVTVFAASDAWLFQRDVLHRQKLSSLESAQASAEKEVADLTATVHSTRDELAHARTERERIQADLDAARRGGSDEATRLRADKAALEKKLADLADRLGESEGARAAAEKRASELDQVMDALAKRRINARRLAGLDAPPRLAGEVVSEDDGRVPPVLILRVRDALAGLEEGDALYLVRATDGQEREAGRATVERIDPDRRLVQARVTRLDAGERISVGDRFTSYLPGH